MHGAAKNRLYKRPEARRKSFCGVRLVASFKIFMKAAQH